MKYAKFLAVRLLESHQFYIVFDTFTVPTFSPKSLNCSHKHTQDSEPEVLSRATLASTGMLSIQKAHMGGRWPLEQESGLPDA